MKKRISVSWSGGKDSALALHRVIQQGELEIDHIHTVFDQETKRVGLHGIHESLIEAQSEMLKIPLRKLYLPASKDHSAYQDLMKSYYQQLKAEKISHVMFGDIFLEDLKSFRDDLLSSAGIEGVYPLWKEDSHDLIHQFLCAGFRTRICAADSSLLDDSFLGQTITSKLVGQFARGIDPCGENGEFHTFLVDGPLFERSLAVSNGQVVRKKYDFNRIDEQGDTVKEFKESVFQDMTLD